MDPVEPPQFTTRKSLTCLAALLILLSTTTLVIAAEEFFEGFGYCTGIPAGWIDISTSAQRPRCTVLDGQAGLLLSGQEADTEGVDSGLQVRYLNPTGSFVWSLEVEARDVFTDSGGSWGFGMGDNVPQTVNVEFCVNCGVSVADPNFVYRLNRLVPGEPNSFFVTRKPRDSDAHLFKIASDGQDLALSIDGVEVGVLAAEAFAARTLTMGVSTPSAEARIDSVRFRAEPVPEDGLVLRNGDFEEGLRFWREFSLPGCGGDRTVELVPIDGPFSNVLEVKSMDAGRCRGSSEVLQDLSIVVGDYDSIVLTADTKAMNSTVAVGCGFAGDEMPVEFQIEYESLSSEQKLLWIDFLL